MSRNAERLNECQHWQEFLYSCQSRSPELEPALRALGELEVTQRDRDLARRLLTELATRITATDLRYREGDEAAALDSLYQLFVQSRKEIVEGGHEARAFAGLAVIFLERMLRPFTGRWHRRKLAGALELQDERRRFRRELPRLRGGLDSFRLILEDLSDSHELTLPPRAGVGKRFLRGTIWPREFIGPTPEGQAESSLPALVAELEQIGVRRKLAYSEKEQQEFGGLGEADGQSRGLVGLALSGGGIRSATFCLGVVQCLTKYGLLRDVDYLSTVSGGGYLGSFLSSRLHRRGRGLDGDSYDTVLDNLLVKPDGRTGDAATVRWLRNNSKYLLSRDGREQRRLFVQVLKGLIPGFPSLHSLYRDRLARGYLHEDYQGTVEIPRVSELLGTPAPYHLINTAVNLPGSKNPELRGRRSDFFVISPLFTGSVVTGYCETKRVEGFLESRRDPFDLASAMAISGAAVSSHMGMRSYGALARTALIAANIRLGKWLPNPGQLARGNTPNILTARGTRWHELRGVFDEHGALVNLSDGGHVENLGLYELLRRRCKFVIVVDGECDPGRTSISLIKATRLAKIDLGVDIDIDVADLHLNERGFSQTHWAFGTVDYNPRGATEEIGYLLYLKLSVTGNEPDYVKAYQSRNPAFPHQSTADQLFDEDQFEAYRALGEHVAEDLFGTDIVTLEELRAERFRSKLWLQRLIRELL